MRSTPRHMTGGKQDEVAHRAERIRAEFDRAPQRQAGRGVAGTVANGRRRRTHVSGFWWLIMALCVLNVVFVS